MTKYRPTKLDKYFIDIANSTRASSKDTSSKIGVVIVDSEGLLISTGYNRFPIGVRVLKNRLERPLKYQYTCHAEVDAICKAAKHGISTRNATLYLVGMGPPTAPCIDCSKTIIQSGIKKVIGAYFKPLPEHWDKNCNDALDMLNEAGVTFHEYGDLEKLLK